MISGRQHLRKYKDKDKEKDKYKDKYKNNRLTYDVMSHSQMLGKFEYTLPAKF